MNRLLKVALTLGLISSFALCAQGVKSADGSIQSGTRGSAQSITQDSESQAIKVMREYRGVKLGCKRDQVHSLLGKPANSNDNSEDYGLTGDDTMTVHYENGEVKAIQMAFFDTKNVPAWKDVVGDAEVNQTESGAKHARKVVSKENFWVSIWQNKDSSMTRITISR